MYQPRPCWLLFPYLKGAWYWKTSCLFWSSNMNHWIWVFFEMKWNYFSTEYDCKIKCYVGLNPKVVKTQKYWLKWRRKIWIIMGKTESKNGTRKLAGNIWPKKLVEEERGGQWQWEPWRKPTNGVDETKPFVFFWWKRRARSTLSLSFNSQSQM